MVETDRPKVEVNVVINNVVISKDDCFKSGCILANIVSEKGTPIDQLAEELATIVYGSPETILDKVRECIGTGSCNRYLESGRKILERKGYVFLTLTGINREECCTVYGYVCSRNGIKPTDINDSAKDHLKDNRYSPW